MAILAIDTASSYLSLGLRSKDSDDYILTQVNNDLSEHLIPQIQSLLKRNQINLDQIETIIYNQGPGSFTGLRIGLGVALGIALGLEIKLVPVESFLLYAQMIANQDLDISELTIGLDAKLNQVYFAKIDLTKMQYIIKPSLVNLEQIEIKANDTLIGNAFNVHAKEINFNPNQLIQIDGYPHASHLIDVGLSLNPVLPEDAGLLYLRDKVALNLAEQKHLKKALK